MDTLWNDLCTAARALARRPAMVSVAVLTLALGIGASTTVFSWICSFLLEPVAGILFGVSPAHPPSYLAATLVLVAVAALACLAPARRAARPEPMAVLRAE